MAVDEQSVRELSLLAYEAASGAVDWSSFLGGVTRVTGGHLAGLFTPPLDPGQGFWGGFLGMGPDEVEAFRTRWSAEDPWFQRYMENQLPINGFVAAGSDYLAPREMRATAFFSDWARHLDIAEPLTLSLSGHGVPFTVLAMVQGPNQPSFGSEERRLLQSIAPVMRRAFHTYWVLQRSVLAGVEQGTVAMLDALPKPLWVLGGDARILHANPIARKQHWVGVGAGGVLREVGELTEPCWHALLRRAVAGEVVQTGIWFAQKNALRVAVLRLVPLPPQHELRLTWPQAAVLMQLEPQDSALDHATRLQALAQRCGLTVTEAKVLRELCAGATLEQIATHGGLRITTVRTHVKHLMEKADVSRQVDLVRLVAGM